VSDAAAWLITQRSQVHAPRYQEFQVRGLIARTAVGPFDLCPLLIRGIRPRSAVCGPGSCPADYALAADRGFATAWGAQNEAISGHLQLPVPGRAVGGLRPQRWCRAAGRSNSAPTVGRYYSPGL
jgi:hypothetical protein